MGKEGKPKKIRVVNNKEDSRVLVAKLNEKVAELEKSEEELRYLSSVLGAIRNINQLIVGERDKAKLLKDACRILLKVREYRFVWIGLIEEGHKRVIPVARAGVEGGYLDSVEITWDDRQSGRGPTGTAIKTRQPDMIKNIPENPRAIPWREEALKRGYRSSAAIPLIHGDKIYGALNVYSSQPEGFNDAEVELLVEVSGDLGFALKAIERQEARQRAEEKLQTILKTALDGFWLTNLEGKILEVNDSYCKMVGYTREELLKMSISDLEAIESPEEVAQHVKRIIEQGYGSFESRHKRKDGKIISVEISVNYLDVGEGQLFVFARDITERKQAENILRMSERDLAEAQELAHVGNWRWEIIPDEVYWSDEAYRLFGVEPGEAVDYAKYLSIVLPEDRDFIMKEVQDALDGIKPYENEHRIVRNGEIRIHHTKGTVTQDEQGKPIRLFGVVQDITERKQAEDALRESEARYRAVIEGAHDMIQSVGFDGSIIFVNKSWLDTLGYAEAELSNLNLFEIVHPDSRAHYREMFAEVAKGKPIHGVEAAFLTKDGRKILVEGNAAPRYIGSRVVAAHCVLRDVTESKRAEEALRESEAFQSGLLANSPIPISVVNPDGSLRYVSPALVKLTGYSAEELVGRKPPYPYWPKERRQEVMKGFKRAIRQGGEGVAELYKNKRGENFWVELTTTPVKKDGKFQYLLANWVDITERKQAEDALRESEARYRAVIEGAHDMIQSVGFDGSIIFVNKSWLDTLGYAEAELSNLNLFEIVHPDSRAHYREMFAEVAKGKPIHGVEAAFLTKDGRKILVEGNAAPRYIGSKVVATQGIFRDVTERKRAEAALADEATRHRILIDESSDGIVILDENGKVYEANRRFAEMLAYSPEEVRKLNVWDWEFQYPREQVAEMIRTVDETGDHFETKHRRKDGTTFDVEISTNGAVYAGQKLIFCVCRDITARKQAEAALRESEEKYKNLVGATSDIIWETDAEGRFTFISPKIKDILGYSVNEVVGKKRTLDLIPEREKRKWLKRFKELNAKRKPFFGLEITHVHKNGRQVIFETSGIPLFDSAGEFKGFVGIDKDITERRQMQEQLVITDRLASVGELAAGIAHELNNPLTGVIGFSQLLMDREMPDDAREDLQAVYSEAQRASQVVKNLLTFARKHTAAKEKVNINDVINKVLELRTYELNLENIKVDARLDSELPKVMADYFQLQQVFLNIIINAEYFMKEAHNKGTLTITTEKVGTKVKVSFADDGPGIDKDDLGHLFDPFFTTKEVGKGTGLGLSICHGIIAEHGGRIYAESELGKGATFIVELPIGAAEDKGGAA